MIRTKNRRFVTNRVKFSPKIIGKALIRIKNDRRLTWRKFGRIFNVSEHVIRYEWKYAKTTIPQPAVKKLEKLLGSRLNGELLPTWWGQRIGPKSKIEPLTRIPQIDTEDFAEFYGALLGDGCIYSTQASFCITCNGILDKSYLEIHLKNLCKRLFGIAPKIYYAKNENAIRLVINSRKINKFLIQIGFPVGRKYQGDIRIPSAFLANRRLAAAFLKGLMDTDGGVHGHPNSGIMMEFSSIIPEILRIVQHILRLFNIKAGISKNKVQFYGKDKVQAYFNLIGSNNPRNKLRFIHFMQEGYIPRAFETERLLKV